MQTLKLNVVKELKNKGFQTLRTSPVSTALARILVRGILCARALDKPCGILRGVFLDLLDDGLGQINVTLVCQAH